MQTAIEYGSRWHTPGCNCCYCRMIRDSAAAWAQCRCPRRPAWPCGGPPDGRSFPDVRRCACRCDRCARVCAHRAPTPRSPVVIATAGEGLYVDDALERGDL